MSAKITRLACIMILATGCLGLPWERRTTRMGPAGPDTGPEDIQRRDAMMQRLASVPEDQREFMSKQILQALSEIIQREDCTSDYQGWVDFGRRSSD